MGALARAQLLRLNRLSCIAAPLGRRCPGALTGRRCSAGAVPQLERWAQAQFPVRKPWSETSNHVVFAFAVSKKWLRRTMYGLLAFVVGTGLTVYLCSEGLWRLLRLQMSLVPMFLDYQWLSFKVSHLPEELQKPHFDAYHRKWADEPLRVCLDLKGFYVKMGQVASGQLDMLPEPYSRSLQVLQERAPWQPVEVIRGVLEEELGCKVEDVFRSFAAEPLGSASIGQVHAAELLDGTKVVVKVQYPNTERFWTLDFLTFIALYKYLIPGFVDTLWQVKRALDKEFDYPQEARNLRRMCDNVRGKFDRINFPEPYDEAHAGLPQALREQGQCLVTKRVLVMDYAAGCSISSIGGRLCEEYARSKGQTADELKQEIKQKMHDPEFVRETMHKQPSKATLMAYRFFLVGRNALRNGTAATYNWTLGWLGATIPYEWSTVPPNGPALMQLLYDVHAFQILEEGAFNADPHAGNIILDEKSSTVSLIDYGQLFDVPEEKRIAFAKLMIAIDKEDSAGVVEAYSEFGNKVIHPPTGERNPEWLIYAANQLYFGGTKGVKYCLDILGFKTFAEILGPEIVKQFDIEFYDPHFFMIYRCLFCLRGVADNFGIGGLSQASLLRPICERYLQSKGLLA